MNTKDTKTGTVLLSQAILGLILFLAVLLTGCVTAQSRMGVWKKGSETLNIQARGKSDAFSTHITLFVNGVEVAKGSTTQFNSTANLTGTYNGHKIDADCKSVAVGTILHREATVYVDGEKATDLSF